MRLLFSRFRELSMVKQTSKDDNQTQMLNLDNIFHWKDEENSFAGMFTEGKYAKSRKPIPYKREKPIEQIRWDNFLSQIVNPMDDNKPYTNGEGRGHCLGKEGPKRVIYSITRLRTNDNSEYLLSNGAITGTINLETD